QVGLPRGHVGVQVPVEAGAVAGEERRVHVVDGGGDGRRCFGPAHEASSSVRTTRPPFMTQRTPRNAEAPARGSSSIAIRSAYRPGSTVPRSFSARSQRAGPRV